MELLRDEPPFDFRGECGGDYPEGDVFKIDCEGCEEILLLEKLKHYGLWFVALHDLPTANTTSMVDSLVHSLGGEIIHSQQGEVVCRGGFERLDR